VALNQVSGIVEESTHHKAINRKDFKLRKAASVLSELFGKPINLSSPRQVSHRDANSPSVCAGVGVGGASRDRTDGLVVANDALSQLSYSPIRRWVLLFTILPAVA
jgi:hypothetical protein